MLLLLRIWSNNLAHYRLELHRPEQCWQQFLAHMKMICHISCARKNIGQAASNAMMA